MSVVTIRGTNPKVMSDLFQDAMLYNSVALWLLAGQVLVKWP